MSVRGETSRRHIAALCVLSKLTQPLLAIATFALSPLYAGVLPGALGLAGGSLAFLVLTELLPDAYRKVKPSLVSAIATAAAGLVVMLEGFLS